jgi:nicotinamidase-related amidase
MANIDEISEFLVPEKSVLVLWDLQKMLVDNIFNKDEFLKNVQALASSARAKGVPVFLTKITPLPDRFQSAGRRYMMSKRPRPLNMTPDGLELAIKPEPGDIVLNKNTASIFVGTNFDLMMRNAGISTIVFTGIATELGVESSAREAGNRGYFPIVVTDAVSSMSKEGHARSLDTMRSLMPLVTANELVEFWKD